MQKYKGVNKKHSIKLAKADYANKLGVKYEGAAPETRFNEGWMPPQVKNHLNMKDLLTGRFIGKTADWKRYNYS